MAGEFDMEAAVADIGGGLGLDLEQGDNDGTTNVDEGQGAAASGSGEAAAGTGAGAEAGAAGEAEAEAEAEAQAAAAAAGDSAKPPPAPGPDDPPSTWSAAGKEKWAALDPAVKAEVQKREGDFFRGIEQYKESAAVGRTFSDALSQYLPILRQHNIDPVQNTRQLFAAQHMLAMGTPQQKLEMVRQIAKDYQIDLTGVGDPANAPPPPPAEVMALQNEMQALQSRLNAGEAARVEQLRQKLSADIDQFAADPKNVYYKELASDMATLLQSGVAKSLSDAYDKALWQNPAVRAKEVARQQTEAKAKADRAEAERVAAAKKAASANLRNKASGGSTAPLGNMDDTLAATLAEIKSRA